MIIANMFWEKKNQKKEDGLPELPPMKGGFDEIRLPIPHESLPSFPDSAQEKGFSQSAIKEAVSDEETRNSGEKFPDAPEAAESGSSKVSELEEWQPSNSDKEKISSNSDSSEEEEMPSFRKPLPKMEMPKKHDVYIKVEKFYTAKKALDLVKSKLEEIEQTLVKIRDTKMREEQELSSWEKELASIKARIQNVTENIFEK